MVILDGINLDGGLEFSAVYSMPGEKPSVPSVILLNLSSSSKEWTYLKCHDVTLLADGKRVELGAAHHDGDTGRDGVRERVSVSVSTLTLLSIARAFILEGRLCGTEFTLRSRELTALRNFASRMRP